ICSGSPGQLGGAPLPGYTYVWTPTIGLSNPNIANPTVTLTNTTGAAITQTYTLKLTSAPITCTNTGTVTITVNPLPAAVPGANIAFCSGGTGQLGGPAVAGLTYSWSPATGLSSSTVANPTVTLTNTTGAPVTQTYTLTATNTATSCTNTGTVNVLVNPNPVAVPGAAAAFCSGGSAMLGGPAVAGLTYSWSPATGLSSATAANPTVTLTNTTGSPVTQTYTLIVTNPATSCNSTGTVAVTVNPNPVAVPGANVTICSGSTAQLGGPAVAGLTYSWSPATGLSSATAANPTVTLTNTTGAATNQTYTLTVTNASTSCTSTGTVVVKVNPNPPITPGANVVICSTETAQLGAAPVAGNTYSWSPATGLNSATIANPTVTLPNTTPSPITQTYTLTVTNTATGCISTGTVDVLVNPVPVPVPGPNITICSGSPGQLGGAPLPGYTYVWTPTIGLSNPNIANPTVTLTNTTGGPITQTYTLKLTSAPITCTNMGTVTVTVNPLPAVAPGANVAICSGGTAQLGAAAVAGLTYSWSPATGLSSSTAANPTVMLTNTTGAPVTQTYTLTVTNTATNCTNTGTVDVLTNPLPTVVAGANIAFCSGDTGQLGGPAVAGYTYSWSPATGLSSSTVANPTVTLTNTTSAAIIQTYTLTVTNTATTCVNTGTVDVTVNPNPVAVPGAAITICSGSPGQLGGPAVTGLTYSWSPATGLSSATAANPTVTLTNTTTAATTQTYILVVTNPATSCTSTGTVVVTVQPLPLVAPGAAITICSGNTGQLGAAAVAGLTYSWSPATGLSSATAANPTVTLTNTTGAVVTQTYTLTVTNTATSCTNTGTVVVTVNPSIQPGTIGANQTVCPLFAANPLTEVTAASAGVGTYTYQWEQSLDNLTWTPIPNATGTTYSPGLLTVSTYFRRRASSGDCASAVSNVVYLQVQPVLAVGVTLPTPAAQCAGTPMTFTPVPTNAGPNPTYRWFVNGTLVATTPTFTSSTLADGDQVQVEVTATVGFCATGTPTATAPVHLIQIPQPAVAVSVKSPLPGCSGEPISFSVDNVLNPGATPTYQWQINGQNVAGATAPTFTTSSLLDGQVVSVILTASTACGPLPVTSAGVPVSVNPAVDVSAGPDLTIMDGDQIYLQGTANGTYPVTWSPAQSLSNPNVLQPLASPTVTTTYTLSATVVNCSDQSTMTVTVTPRLRIPTAFSPNGDGNDDTWQIEHIEEYQGSHVTIFNRWGNKLFETTSYGRGNEWTGVMGGQPAPIGTYYYIITLPNGHSYTGPLTIIY
ncbi:MAG: gliding motility-associated C-terminal domain-containing protein, partial [Janthinobacterium lividum]